MAYVTFHNFPNFVFRLLLRWMNPSSWSLPSTTWISSPRQRRCRRRSPSACLQISLSVSALVFIWIHNMFTETVVALTGFLFLSFCSGRVQDRWHGSRQILLGTQDRRRSFLSYNNGSKRKNRGKRAIGTCPEWLKGWRDLVVGDDHSVWGFWSPVQWDSQQV